MPKTHLPISREHAAPLPSTSVFPTLPESLIFLFFAAVAILLSSSAHISVYFKLLFISYITLEVVFFIYGKLRYNVLNQPITKYPDPHRVRQAMQRFIHLHPIFDLDDFLSGWFLGAPSDTIPRGNIEEFVSYGFFCRKTDDLRPEDRNAVSIFISQVELNWNVTFQPGYNSSLTYMAHVWEPLRVQHKPLVMYAATEAAARIAHLLLICMGFQKKKVGGFTTWTYINDDTRRGKADGGVRREAVEHALDAAVNVASTAAASMTKQYPHEGQQYHIRKPSGLLRTVNSFKEMMEKRVELPPLPKSARQHKKNKSTISPSSSHVTEMNAQPTPPIVFLHGVGFGVLPYLHFIRNLMKDLPGSNFMVLEMPHVALRLCKEAESVDNVATAAVSAVQHVLGAKQACFIGHSYGSFCVSRILQLHPETVHSSAFLDPVCMLTCYPQLLFNFIYRTISLKVFTSVRAAVDGVRFLCSRDLTIAQAFCRKFHWSELMLWPDDLPRKENYSLVVLSGKDDLVPGEMVREQFRVSQHPATVMFHPELGHGGLLLDGEWMRQVVKNVKGLVTRKDE